VCVCVCLYVCMYVIFIRCDKRTSNNKHKKQSHNDVQYKAVKPKKKLFVRVRVCACLLGLSLVFCVFVTALLLCGLIYLCRVFISLVPVQEIGHDERCRRNYVFYVEWEVKPQRTRSINQRQVFIRGDSFSRAAHLSFRQ